MTEAIHITRYKCSTCGGTYGTEAEANKCESRPVSQDRGIRVGDIVKITGGDGAGGLAQVEKVYIIDKDWGHYAYDRYWHTVALTAKVLDSFGHRTLTFDNYEAAT